MLNRVSYYQPLRSAVEHNPLDDEDGETFDTFSRPVSQKQKFLKLVTPNRGRQEKQLNSAAYVIPSNYEGNPQQYRSGSPYQELVDAGTFEKLKLARLEQSDAKSMRKKSSFHRVVCHITNWSFYRKGEGKFVPENLDTKLCTHIIYSFATLEPDSLELREFDPWGDIENQLYARTVNLDKNLPVLLGLGGWTDSNGDKYTRLVSSSRARQNFISRATVFLRQYGFSGVHIDWNYPVCWQSDCRSGPATDREDFTKFIEVRFCSMKYFKLQLNNFSSTGNSQSFQSLQSHVECFDFWIQRNYRESLRL